MCLKYIGTVSNEKHPFRAKMGETGEKIYFDR